MDVIDHNARFPASVVMAASGHSRRFCHIRYKSGYRLISDIDRVKAKPART
jgi:hypothetical protein